MAELKHCPFCGGEAKLKPFKSGIFSKPIYYVVCRCCGCQTAVQLEEADAVEAWNRDALPSADAVEVVRCKDCIYWNSGENEVEKWEHCKLHDIDIGPHAFCSLGDRRGRPNA